MRTFVANCGTEYNSFLDCIAANNYHPSDLDTNAIVEFLTFGSLYGSKTFIGNVSKKTTHQPYNLSSILKYRNKRLRLPKKP